jgi:drug/metabolite transporter (DMT)-like permease
VTAALISLAAAMTWGFSDFGAGLKSRRMPVPVVLLWVESAGIVVVLAAIIATGEPLPDGRTALYSALAGICGLGGLAAFYSALSIGTMSIVAPISATGVTLPVVVGIVTGDRLGFVVAAGLVVTFAGVMLASRETGHAAAANRTAVMLAAASAIGFGGYFAFGDVAADGSILWLLAIGRIIMLPIVATYVVRRRYPLVPARRDRLELGAIGVADLIATGLYGVANTHGALAVVAVVGSMYPVVTMLLARVVLHERLAQWQLVGVGVALVGVSLVSVG